MINNQLFVTNSERCNRGEHVERGIAVGGLGQSGADSLVQCTVKNRAQRAQGDVGQPQVTAQLLGDQLTLRCSQRR